MKAHRNCNENCFEQALHVTRLIMRIICPNASRGAAYRTFLCAFLVYNLTKNGDKNWARFWNRNRCPKIGPNLSKCAICPSRGEPNQVPKTGTSLGSKTGTQGEFFVEFGGHFFESLDICSPQTAMQRRASFCLPGVSKTVRNDNLPADSNRAPTILRR